MRKSLQTKREREDRRKRMFGIIIAVFFVLLLFASTFAYVMTYNTGSNSGIEDSGLTFYVRQQADQYYLETTIADTQHQFLALPSDVASYEFIFDDEFLIKLNTYPNRFMTFDPLSSSVQSLGYAISQIGSVIPTMAVGIPYESSEYDLPVITCEQANEQSVVFQLQIGNESGLVNDNNCYTFTAFDDQDLIYASEYIKYRLLGVEFNEDLS